MKLPGQTVYSRALILFVALSLLLGTAVVLLTQAIILREFKQTEYRAMVVTLQRFGLVLLRELQPLESSLAEWSYERQEGEAVPPTPRQFDDMQMDFFAVLNEDGEVVSLACRDSKTLSLLTPANDLTSFLAGVLTNPSDSKRPQRSGFIRLSDNLVAIAWLPRKSREGLIQYQVAGKIFAGDSWRFLEGLFSAQILFDPLDGVRTSEEGSESLLTMLNKHEYIIEESGDELFGFTLVRGINGNPLGKIQLVQKRPLFREGLRAVQVFLTVLTLAGGALFLLVWLLLDRTILTRIRDLTQKLEKEKRSSRLPVRLQFEGDDELGALARSIEELAGMLEQAQHQYRAVVEDQTEIICRFDADFRLTFANAVFQKVFGTEDSSHARLADCLPASSFSFLARQCANRSPASPVDTFLHEITFAPGINAWFRSTLRGNFSPEGAFVEGQWVAADITLQIEAQKRVQESESRLRSLSSRLLRLQDDERRRIARELHDSTAQSLSGLEMNMSLLEPLITGPRAQRLMAETRQIARDCCLELRNISYLLHPPLLDEVGLIFAIQWFVDGFVKRTAIAVSLDIEAGFSRLERDMETTLFRIIQESMSNIYRHSGASHAWISLRREENAIALKIRDNGRGFPEVVLSGSSGKSPSGMGVGLAGMKERLHQFHGDLNIENSPFGVSIVIMLPLEPSA